MDKLTPYGKRLLGDVLRKEKDGEFDKVPSSSIVEQNINFTQNIKNKADMLGHARILSETMTGIGKEFCKSIESILDEMRRARLTQEYFSLIEQFSDCAKVVDEETVKQKCDEIMNVKMAKMTEKEIMFLVSNFPSPEICKVIKQMTIQNNLSAYKNGIDLICSSVFSVLRIWGHYANAPDKSFYQEEVEIGILCANSKYGYQEISQLYYQDTGFTKEPESYFRAYVNPDKFHAYTHIERVLQEIYYCKKDKMEEFQKSYVKKWNERFDKENRFSRVDWQKAYCEWKTFEDELEAEYILKRLRKICFEMKMNAILDGGNPK